MSQTAAAKFQLDRLVFAEHLHHWFSSRSNRYQVIRESDSANPYRYRVTLQTTPSHSAFNLLRKLASLQSKYRDESSKLLHQAPRLLDHGWIWSIRWPVGYIRLSAYWRSLVCICSRRCACFFQHLNLTITCSSLRLWLSVIKCWVTKNHLHVQRIFYKAWTLSQKNSYLSCWINKILVLIQYLLYKWFINHLNN